MVKVKICGVTSPADAFICAELGADFIGNIVDIPSSPRSISPKKSREILSMLPPRVKGVAVMAPKNPGEVIKAAELINPYYVQLHGDESLEFVQEVKEEAGCRVIKAIHIEGEESVDEALAYSKVCDALLLDTATKGLGGSGKTHDWGISSEIASRVKCHVFLAGGLKPGNLRSALERVEPYCVDVSSGVEKSPGKKDPEKVKEFIKEAKGQFF